MTRNRSLLVLSFLAAGAAGLVLLWTSRDREGARPPAPVGRVGAGTVEVDPDLPAAPAPGSGTSHRRQTPDAGALDLAGAVWIDGRLLLPPDTPGDEEVELIATSRTGGRDREATCSLAPDGSFRAPFAPDATARSVRIEARYLWLERAVPVPPGATSVEVEPRLGAWLTGQLVPPAGASPADVLGAAGGAPVRLQAWGSRGRGAGLLLEAEPGPDLAFELRGVPAGLDALLVWDPVQLALVLEPRLSFARGEHVDRSFPLRRGATVAGRIVDESGAPVAGAEVAAQTAGTPWDLARTRRTTTDASGAFRLGALQPGLVIVSASAPERLPAELEPTTLAGGEVREGLALVLARGGRLAGQVVWPDGRAAAGAEVAVAETVLPGTRTGWRDHLEREARADEAGRFSVAGLGPGPWTVRATAPAPEGGAPWQGLLEEIAASDDVVVELEAPHALDGAVADETGEPVTAFTLRLEHRRRASAGSGLWRREDLRFEDPAGRFRIEGLARGTWTLEAFAEGHAEVGRLELEVPDAVGPVRLVLPRAGAIEGTVVGPGGAPVSGARVEVLRVGERRNWRVEPTVTDHAGRFRLEGLPPETAEVQAGHREWARSEPVWVLAGLARASTVELALRGGGRLEGEVLGADGGPDAERDVAVRHMETGAVETTRTDGLGRFELGPLAAGPYDVLCLPTTGDAWPPRRTAAEVVEGETVRVVLGGAPAAEVELEGRVLAAGEPVPGASVTFLAAEEAVQPPATRTASDGSYAVTLPRAGPWLAVVGGVGEGGATTIPCDVPAARRQVLDLTLPGGALEGVVTDATGTPAARVRVTCERAGAPPLPEALAPATLTDQDGRYAFEHLAPGTWTVRAGSGTAGGGIALAAEVTLADGERVTVDLQLEDAGAVVGFAWRPDGSPATGAAVFVRDETGAVLEPTSTTVAGPDGSFRFEGCAPGTYTLSARAGPLAAPESAPVLVATGEEVPVDLVLEPGTLLTVRAADAQGRALPVSLRVLDEAGREHAGLRAAGPSTSPARGDLAGTRWSVGPLPPGTYAVRATDAEGREAAETVRLGGEPARELLLRPR